MPAKGQNPCSRHCEERLRRSNPCFRKGIDGLLRGACHRARIRATRWLAMTKKRTKRATFQPPFRRWFGAHYWQVYLRPSSPRNGVPGMQTRFPCQRATLITAAMTSLRAAEAASMRSVVGGHHHQRIRHPERFPARALTKYSARTSERSTVAVDRDATNMVLRIG